VNFLLIPEPHSISGGFFIDRVTKDGYPVGRYSTWTQRVYRYKDIMMDKDYKREIRNILSRVFRAAKLDTDLYKEVENDKAALGQALGVVILSGLAAGIGTIGLVGGYGELIGRAFTAVIGWFIWAFLTYWIGTRLLPEPQTQADLGQLLRTIGFSSSPGMIRVLGVLPGLTGFVNFVADIWMLIAMIIAVRQALDYESTWRAVGVCFIGWVVQRLVLALLVRLAVLGMNGG